MRRLSLLVLLVGALVGPARAQWNLPMPARLELLKAGVQAADGFAQKQELTKARFCLLAVTELFDKCRQACPADVQQTFAKVMGLAWPEPVTDANAAQVVADFKTLLADSKAKLGQYAQAFDFMNPHDNLSFEQWAEYVLKARATYPAAEADGLAYASQAPSPAVHLSPVGVQLGAYYVLQPLFRMLVAEDLANHHAKNDILPRSLKKAGEELARYDDSITSPSRLHLLANDVDRLLGYVLAVDPQHAELKPLQERVAAIRKKARELYAARVAENRLPGDAYQRPDAAAVRAQCLASYQRQFPQEQVVKLHLTGSDWVERAVAWWEGEVLKSGVFRYLDGAVAVKGSDGKVRVFEVVFGRQWTGRGDDFGPAGYCQTTCDYEMLASNLP